MANFGSKIDKPIKYNEIPSLSPESEESRTVENYPQWHLPKGVKMRLGKGGIGTIQFSPDGTKLAVSSSIGVWLYDVKTAKELSLFPGRLTPVAFSPDGRFLTNGSISTEGQLDLWDIAARDIIPIQDPPHFASVLWFSDDGKTLTSFSLSKNIINRLDLQTGRSIITEMEERSGYTHLEKYALTEDKIAIGKSEGEVELWNTNTGKQISTLRKQTEKKVNFRIGLPTKNCAVSLAFSSDGTKLACGNLDGTVQVWDTVTGVELFILHKPLNKMKMLFHTPDELLVTNEPYESNSPGIPMSVAFSPDGNMLAVGNINSSIQLWSVQTCEPIVTFTGHISGINKVVFSPDGNTLASASSDGTLRFWDIGTKNPLPSYITGHAWTRTVSYLADSTMLASVSSVGIITVWDLMTSEKTTHKTKMTLEQPRSWHTYRGAVFSPNGTKLATLGLEDDSSNPEFDNYVLRLTDVRTGKDIQVFNEGRAQVFSPDGKIIAGMGGNKIDMLNIETGESHQMIIASEPEEEPNTYTPDLNTFIFTHDSKRIVTGTSGGYVQFWNIENGALLESYFEEKPPVDGSYEDPIRKLVFSPDASLLAVVSSKRVRLLGNRKQRHFEEVFHGESQFDDTIIFSPNNSVLVVSLYNDKIQLLDVPTGDILATFDGHNNTVETLIFSSDGKTLISVGNGTILFWDWHHILTSARSDKERTSEVNLQNEEYTTDKVLTFNEMSSHPAKSTSHILNLAEVYLANEWYEEALERYKRNLYITTSRRIPIPKGNSKVIASPKLEQKLFKQIDRAGKNVKDKDGFVNMLNQLIDISPDSLNIQLYTYTVLTKFYGAYGMSEKAAELMQKILRITEDIPRESYGHHIFVNIALVEFYLDRGLIGESEKYIQKTKSIIDNLSFHPIHNPFIANFKFAEFFNEYGMPDKAKEYIQKTGFVTEDAWMVLGPFDNTNGMGYDTAYIPEDMTVIDRDAIYDGLNGPVQWKLHRDDEFDGYIHLGEKDVNWHVGYAFTTVTSPEEREVQFRFDSDDQGKVWVNGKEVFSHTKTFMAMMDYYTIPVTLKTGKNSILIKVCNEEGGWAFYLRVTGTEGNTFFDLKFGD